MRRFASCLAALVLALPAAAAADELEIQQESELTVYRDGLAQVTVRRSVDLPDGATRIAMSRISPGVIAESLHLVGEGVRVVEQRLSPWPINRQRLLQAFVGEEVILARPMPDGREWLEEEAELVSIDDGIVLRIDGRVEVDPIGRIIFPDLPKHLAEEPEAVFHVVSDEEGTRRLNLRYLTRGVSWRADYVARWDDAAERLDLSGIATVESSLSLPVGADRLRLVAGEVAREDAGMARHMAPMAAMEMDAAPEAPAPEALAELTVYTLDFPVTLEPGDRLQHGLLEARGVEAEAQYRVLNLAVAHRMHGVRRATAQLRLDIPDTRAAGLDEPLPAGTIRVYADDIFRGEKRIADTPVGTPLNLDLGAAFDITAEARQTDYERIERRVYEAAQEIVVRNAKDREATVQVIGSFPSDWRMLEESHPHERETATQPVWRLDVPAEGEATLTYRVRIQS